MTYVRSLPEDEPQVPSSLPSPHPTPDPAGARASGKPGTPRGQRISRASTSGKHVPPLRSQPVPPGEARHRGVPGKRPTGYGPSPSRRAKPGTGGFRGSVPQGTVPARPAGRSPAPGGSGEASHRVRSQPVPPGEARHRGVPGKRPTGYGPSPSRRAKPGTGGFRGVVPPGQHSGPRRRWPEGPTSSIRRRVGLRGLEPRASSLSGTRSNRLSYNPIDLRKQEQPSSYRTGEAGCAVTPNRRAHSVSRRVTSTPPISREVRL